ncbi:MAG: response regulator [Thermoanaerobaculia bacterium]
MKPRPRILVVDDDAPILILMKNLLREFGFEPVIAADGAEAINAVKASRPDLMLIDRNMPGMSGDAVVRALRSEGGDPFPILILSGEPIEREELDRIGANGAVLKPFDVTALIDEIHTRLNGD